MYNTLSSCNVRYFNRRLRFELNEKKKRIFVMSMHSVTARYLGERGLYMYGRLRQRRWYPFPWWWRAAHALLSESCPMCRSSRSIIIRLNTSQTRLVLVFFLILLHSVFYHYCYYIYSIVSRRIFSSSYARVIYVRAYHRHRCCARQSTRPHLCSIDSFRQYHNNTAGVKTSV
jgi:hypothetical protein